MDFILYKICFARTQKDEFFKRSNDAAPKYFYASAGSAVALYHFQSKTRLWTNQMALMLFVSFETPFVLESGGKVSQGELCK